ncbi:enoyl-CoA hydratase [candidate division KSB1 bacterium]|nr:enoyl-CoA hydratase [candidate division KSB1 bacterium]
MKKLVLTQYQDDHNLALVALNNPPLNLSTRELKNHLLEVLTGLDSACKAVVIYGEGEKAFSVGSDIKELHQATRSRSVIERAEHENFLNDCIADFNKPIIAALHGYVLGGGLELALACDLRVCDAHTVMALPEIKLGLFPGGGGSERLPRLVGYARAMEMILTGESIDAQRALLIGLVNRIATEQSSLQEAIQLARLISRHSLSAIMRVKQLLKASMEHDFSTANRMAQTRTWEAFSSPEGREGVSAFLEKRSPQFQD